MIASNMTVLFNSPATSATDRAEALRAAIIGAVRQNRFAAMDTCSKMTTSIAEPELGQRVQQILQEHDTHFIRHIEPSECQAPAVRAAVMALKAAADVELAKTQATDDEVAYSTVSHEDVQTSFGYNQLLQRRPDVRRRPGEIRDAIVQVLSGRPMGASVAEITNGVGDLLGEIAPSSVRSYLQLNTPDVFARTERAQYMLVSDDGIQVNPAKPVKRMAKFTHGRATLYQADCMDWLQSQPASSIHAVVTDPPYGLVEYTDAEQLKLRSGVGGVWRIPPSFDGSKRAPLPRFTTLTATDHVALEQFFAAWGRDLLRVLVPGANVVVASNPLLSFIVSGALSRAGLERRGEIARLVMTMRGGDRPKHAHVEFSDVSVMPRSMWEPWLVFRKPLEGRAQDNLRKWGTGGFRRISEDQPFGDVIESAPTRANERDIAPHPSLKPQAFLRRLVRGVLPLGKGIVLDPFAGAASTLAAAEAVGYESIGIERDKAYFNVAAAALPRLAAFGLATRGTTGGKSR